MIRVFSRRQIGSVTTTLEYYAAAEPRLLQLRDDYRNKVKTRDEVMLICGRVAGIRAVERDMENVEGEAGSSKQINEFIRWQEEHPLATRLYGAPGVIAALVMAPEGATEVEYIDCGH